MRRGEAYNVKVMRTSDQQKKNAARNAAVASEKKREATKVDWDVVYPRWRKMMDELYSRR